MSPANVSPGEETDIVSVPAGVLIMGSSSEEIQYCVNEWRARLLDNRYVSVFGSWIAKEYPPHPKQMSSFTAMRFPVTNGEFSRYLHDNDDTIPESIETGMPDDHPVWGVTLGQAEAFAIWRRGVDGRPWRLPTEAEWEWMAAGPEKRRYPYGEQFDSRCGNTIESEIGRTTSVYAHPKGKSWCGAYDLAGNVEEWTTTRYAPYPGGQFVDDDLTRLVGFDYPILRGGSFALGGDLTRCSRRHGPHPGKPFRITGFRLVHEGTRP
jgi:toxoflavin biosynthesis protein ToxD